MIKDKLRLNICLLVLIIIYIIIGFFLFALMINNKSIYDDKLHNINNKYINGLTAPRGRIIDCNGNILVDNKVVPILIYNKPAKITINNELLYAKKVNEIINIDVSNITNDDLKEYFILTNDLSNRLSNEEINDYKKRKITNEEYNTLLKSKITSDDLLNYNDEDKAVYKIYKLMNSGYSFDFKIIKRDLLSSEISMIIDNIELLPGFTIDYDWERVYLYGDVLKNILGRVSTSSEGIPKDDYEYYSSDYKQNDRVGVSGLEKEYDEYLKGTKSKYKVLENNTLKLIKECIPGNDIILTIDINLQKDIEAILGEEILYAKKEANTKYYKGSYVVISNPKTGGILAITGKNAIKENNQYILVDDTRSIFVSPMTPGSIVKGASMIVGYNTGAIKIGDYMKDECIKIKGTPKKCSHANLGLINDIDALAYSSNVYQFKIAMKMSGNNYYYGFKMNASKKDFDYYRKIFNEFGLGVLTDVDFPIESVGNIGNKYDPGLLLDFAMGQYDTYTVMQMNQYITTIANDGVRVMPHFVSSINKYSSEDDIDIINKIDRVELNRVTTDISFIKRVQEGFKAVMNYGLGKGLMPINYKPAGKTGTSETFLDTNGNGVIDTESISNAFIGYAPYDNPTMTITITSPNISIPSSNSSYFSYVNRRLTKKISAKYFELYSK